MIGVFYSCHKCHLIKIPLDVPEREQEDIRHWMDKTIQLIAADHARRSPHCHPKTLSDLLIPLTGRKVIGGPVVQ